MTLAIWSYKNENDNLNTMIQIVTAMYLSYQDRKHSWVCYVTHAKNNSSWFSNKFSHMLL